MVTTELTQRPKNCIRLNQILLGYVERCVTRERAIDGLPGGIAAVACVVALFLPWEHNSISGTKTAFELLGSSSERHSLVLFLVGIAVATVATLTRQALLSCSGPSGEGGRGGDGASGVEDVHADGGEGFVGDADGPGAALDVVVGPAPND
jgi:hypothetical protein